MRYSERALHYAPRLAAALLATMLIMPGPLTLPLAAQPNKPDRSARRGAPVPLTANPSAALAEELALARAMRERGEAKALAKYAAENAELLPLQGAGAQTSAASGQPMAVKAALASGAYAPRPSVYNAQRLISSCDGTLTAVIGGWVDDASNSGRYVTLWERDKRGKYRWRLRGQNVQPREGADSATDEDDGLSAIRAEIAACPEDTDAAYYIGCDASNEEAMQRSAAQDTTLRFAARLAEPLNGGAGLRLISSEAARDGSLIWGYAEDAAGNVIPAIGVSQSGGEGIALILPLSGANSATSRAER